MSSKPRKPKQPKIEDFLTNVTIRLNDYDGETLALALGNVNLENVRIQTFAGEVIAYYSVEDEGAQTRFAVASSVYRSKLEAWESRMKIWKAKRIDNLKQELKELEGEQG